MPSLQEILEALPNQLPRPQLEAEVSGVGYVQDAVRGFVEPELELESDQPIEPGSTRLVVISASAAVGKTTLAHAIASARDGMLWELGNFNLGDGSFAGIALKAFGNRFSGFLEAVKAGQALVVMDALDEATVRAGEDNVEAFLRDLGTLLQQAAPELPPVLMLARSEAALLTTIVAEEIGLPTAHYSIAYFDQRRAEEFIDLRLDEDPTSSHRIHREGFEEARGLLFDSVFDVLGVGSDGWEEPRARAFLGYAPVLEALSEYLNQPNFSALKSELENPGTERQTIWEFLIDIVDRILLREQEKLVSNLPESLAEKLDAQSLARLYDPDEQCSRLAARVLKAALPTSSVPPRARAEYEETAQKALSEHPFLSTSTEFASAVFAEYVWAQVLQGGTSALRDGVRAHLVDAGHRASPLLARFMIEMSSEGREKHSLSLLDFPIFYDSIRAEDAPGRPVGLSVREEEQRIVAEVHLPAEDSPLELHLEEQSDLSLHFARRLSQADINVERLTLQLGRNSEEFSLGPNVSVKAATVVIGCRELRVEARQGATGGVLLATDKLVTEAPNPELRLSSAAKVEIVTSQNLPYPWAEHRREPVPPSPDLDAFMGPLSQLARIVSWFRSQGYGGLGTHVKPIEAAVAKGRLSEEMLDYAKTRGLISVDGKMLRLNPDSVPLNFEHIKAGLLDDQATIDFLKGYLSR